MWGRVKKSINRLDVRSDIRLAVSKTEPNINTASSEEAKSKFRTDGDSIRSIAVVDIYCEFMLNLFVFIIFMFMFSYCKIMLLLVC